MILNPICHSYSCSNFLLPSAVKQNYIIKHLTCLSISRRSDLEPDSIPSPKRNTISKERIRQQNIKLTQKKDENPDRVFPATIPRKPRRGRRSEKAAVEDFVRDRLQQTFASIRQQNGEILKDKEDIMKDMVDDEIDSDDGSNDEDDKDGYIRGKEMVIEEDDPDWPLDADVGWGIRASEYFEKHPIKNIVGEDGVEIDWEGEIDDTLVKEINCLEWESFAFHPSPLIVLVFERYNRATHNWKVLKELEKATKVYWSAKDRLPPRTVKIDINIERDLAYALKVRESPQILFLRGNRILYREKNIRTSDELVQMIAHFYYNAKKPSWISDVALS
ncbi:unnamed protein product [Ilex paraguariensis]|uniref:Thioredoxin-like fold domain-containing protein MRL7, chloroplastic n=1 Tax=Ilex paraguariensis TaxID=185542 RepID=A0ABC8R8U8_9AQUA